MWSPARWGGKYFSVIDPEDRPTGLGYALRQGSSQYGFRGRRTDGATRRLIVPLNNFRGFAVVDFATHKEIARISLPDEPSGFLLGKKLERRNITPTHGVVIAPDGKTMWVASRGSNAVFAYSLPDFKMLGYVPTPTLEGAQHPMDGGDPGWLTITPDGKTLYVANAATNSVSAIDAKTFKEVARIPVGEQPDHVESLVLP